MNIEFKGYWSTRDKEIWENTNWKERNYEELPIEDDTFESLGYFYSENGTQIKKLTFIKYIRPNPIYPPYYGPLYNSELKEFMKEGNYCYPMYDGNLENNYQVHDRFETNEVSDILSN